MLSFHLLGLWCGTCRYIVTKDLHKKQTVQNLCPIYWIKTRNKINFVCERNKSIKTKKQQQCPFFFLLLGGWRYENTGEIQAKSQCWTASQNGVSKTFPALGHVLVPMIKLERGLLWREKYWIVMEVSLKLLQCSSPQAVGSHLVYSYFIQTNITHESI